MFVPQFAFAEFDFRNFYISDILISYAIDDCKITT